MCILESMERCKRHITKGLRACNNSTISDVYYLVIVVIVIVFYQLRIQYHTVC